MKTTRLLALNEGVSAMYGIILDINIGATAHSGSTGLLLVRFSEFAEVLSQARFFGFSAEIQAFVCADKGNPSARVIF
jgi:hypothetical protein